MMTKVYFLWHVHEVAGAGDDEKLIGVYATEADAMGAIDRLRHQPGFKDFPEGFQIVSYTMNADHWREGFISVVEAMGTLRP
ncbi:MAG TPA: hypothetical protein VGQ90_17260 [Stellaceae bacterium]|nr:hypothetical protein [Stellaceae bacterium]